MTWQAQSLPTPRSSSELVAKRLRDIGLDRILFGTDYASVMNLPPAEAWEAFKMLPLTAEEFSIVANNIAPYLERRSSWLASFN